MLLKPRWGGFIYAEKSKKMFGRERKVNKKERGKSDKKKVSQFHILTLNPAYLT